MTSGEVPAGDQGRRHALQRVSNFLGSQAGTIDENATCQLARVTRRLIPHLQRFQVAWVERTRLGVSCLIGPTAQGCSVRHNLSCSRLLK